MRTKILGLVVLTLVTVTTSFANNNEDNVNAKALSAFSQKFSDAKEVNWLKTENYYKATFKMNEQVYTAFITEAGNWMGVSRNILSYQLPINLQSDLKKDYSNFWISDLFEFSTDDLTSYYITVENADQKVTLKTTGGSEWSVLKKAKKNS